MVIQMNRTYDNAPPTILFDIVMGTTACSPTVFDGLLAWANRCENNPSKAETTSRQRSFHPRWGRGR
jgi:hypothetical protein